MVTYFTEEHRKKAFETRMRNKQLREQTNNVKPEPEVKPITSQDVERKRSELEALRLDVEIEKLRRPDTSVDYYGKMLELQERHNQQLLEMQKNQFNIQLELEKMRIGTPSEEDGFGDILESLKPMLPLIAEGMKKHNNQKEGLGSKSPLHPEPSSDKNKKEKTKTMDENETLESYKQKIREGKITEEQAWIDFQEQVPPVIVKQMGYSGFKANFDKVKAEGKTLNSSETQSING